MSTNISAVFNFFKKRAKINVKKQLKKNNT